MKVLNGPKLWTENVSNLRFLKFEEVMIMDVWMLGEKDFLRNVLHENNKPRYIISDQYYEIADCSYADIVVPSASYFYRIGRRFAKENEFSTNTETRVPFSFMFNRRKVARHLCVKLFEYFNLTQYNYSMCFEPIPLEENLVNRLLQESTVPNKNRLKEFLLATSKIKCQILANGTSYSSRAEIPPDQLLTSTGDDKVFNYEGITNLTPNLMAPYKIAQPVIDSSAVHIISETSDFGETTSAYTEKTVFSIVCNTFPIWAGGWHQVRNFKEMGFDTFDDVIDNSYDLYDSFLDRCYYAVANNLEILSDNTHASRLRNNNMDRLIENRQHLFSEKSLEHFWKRLEKYNLSENALLYLNMHINSPHGTKVNSSPMHSG